MIARTHKGFDGDVIFITLEGSGSRLILRERSSDWMIHVVDVDLIANIEGEIPTEWSLFKLAFGISPNGALRPASSSDAFAFGFGQLNSYELLYRWRSLELNDADISNVSALLGPATA